MFDNQKQNKTKVQRLAQRFDSRSIKNERQEDEDNLHFQHKFNSQLQNDELVLVAIKQVLGDETMQNIAQFAVKHFRQRSKPFDESKSSYNSALLELLARGTKQAIDTLAKQTSIATTTTTSTATTCMELRQLVLSNNKQAIEEKEAGREDETCNCVLQNGQQIQTTNQTTNAIASSSSISCSVSADDQIQRLLDCITGKRRLDNLAIVSKLSKTTKYNNNNVERLVNFASMSVPDLRLFAEFKNQVPEILVETCCELQNQNQKTTFNKRTDKQQNAAWCCAIESHLSCSQCVSRCHKCRIKTKIKSKHRNHHNRHQDRRTSQSRSESIDRNNKQQKLHNDEQTKQQKIHSKHKSKQTPTTIGQNQNRPDSPDLWL